MQRALLAILGVGSLLAAGCGAARKPSAELTVYLNDHRGQQIYYVRCRPARGNTRQPSHTCSEVAKHEKVLFGPERHLGCGLGYSTVEIDGTYDGREISRTFSGCFGTGESENLWREILGGRPPTALGTPHTSG